jgi:hypothetical protein
MAMANDIAEENYFQRDGFREGRIRMRNNINV